MAERRRETRQKTFLKGRILFNKGASSMDCLVRDMSPDGARLSLTETTVLPGAFDLYIPQKEKTYRANLAWRRADGVGITFVDEAAALPAVAVSPAEESPLLMLTRRIAELEAENAALRRLLAASSPATEATRFA